MGSSNALKVVPTDDRGTICLLARLRDQSEESGELVILANFSEHQKSVSLDTSAFPSLLQSPWTDLVQGKHVRLAGEQVILGPYELLLLKRNR